MTLSSGTRLGPYEILAPLGAGGMGEVYRAKDTNLDRDVAIKVLPESFARDPERVARFEREAKLLASLNHPNIAAIHGFDDADGTRFLVMEYVEGETLAQRLKRSAFAVEDALDVARQIAEALEAAHEKVVIHRDLKPGNVMIRPDGTVKVLDFGLAKAMAEESSTSVPADSPTITANFTRPGVILGTAAYMSPEQARGRVLDKRTDIWSFGCVLYECLGGCRPFNGETSTDLIARILEREPDWGALPSNTPPTVRLLLRRCLTKDPKKRLHDIADARIEIQEAIADPTASSLALGDAGLSGARLSPGRTVWERVLPWAAGLLFGALGTWLMLSGTGGLRDTAATSAPLQLELPLRISEGDPEHGVAPSRLAIAPDGMAVVCEFVGADRRLVVRELNSFDARPLAGTEGAEGAFFSPDGRWIGFFKDGQLQKIPRAGGAPLPICRATNATQVGLWTEDGTIIVTSESRTTLLKTHETGGDLVEFTSASSNPELLGFETLCRVPGQRYFLCGAYTGNTIEADEIVAVSLDDGSIVTIIPKGSDPSVVADGFVVYLRDSSLYAVPIDFDSKRVLGFEARVLDGVTSNQWGGDGAFDVSWNGTLTFVPGQRFGVGRRLVWVDPTGQIEALSDDRDAFVQELRLSPDGKRVAVNTLRRGLELWSFEIERQAMLRLNAEGEPQDFVWDPTGNRLAFSRVVPEKGYNVNEVIVRDVVSGSVRRLPLEGYLYHPYSWLPDGDGLLIGRIKNLPPPQHDSDLFVFRFEEREPLTPYLETSTSEWDASMSRDGKWVVYASNESGRAEVYLRAFPDDGRKWQVSYSGCGRSHIRWAADDSKVYWVGNDSMMSASVQTQPDVVIGVPAILFRSPWPSAPDRWAAFDVGADGRFVMIEPAAWEQEARDVRVVLHWNNELRRRLRVQND